MGVVGIDHVQLAIPENGEADARHFFCGLLGMEEVAKPSNLSPSGCWFQDKGTNVHVGVDPGFRAATKAHPAFLVDNLVELRSRLESEGFQTKDDKPVDGYDRFFTSDPFGNRIEIMQRISD